ncbi:MAG TPA: type II toxin-antitoxin system prevent-host-death family antitoxin [Microvirga sp.]|nr:type II toxin-antitoxin system prevent-host-death family antitoxin [Microvirga sp.]
MPHVNFTEFRQNLASHMDAVCESRAPLVVTRQKGPSVVVMSEEEYEGMQETIHLLRSPRNVKHLLTSIAELNAGNGTERDLAE